MRLKRALPGQKLPCSYELEDTLRHVGYHLHNKRKNTGLFIFRALQNGVKYIEIRENLFFFYSKFWFLRPEIVNILVFQGQHFDVYVKIDQNVRVRP